MANLCLICGSAATGGLLARSGAPALQNAVYPDAASARAALRGDLDFRRCEACGFVWNAAFRSERIAYAPGYENRQSLSPAFRQHLGERAAAALALLGEHQDVKVVEVGCGQGDFLTILAETARRPLSLFGFDPAWRGEDGAGPAGAHVRRAMFDERSLSGGAAPDLVVSRHVIEHIADPIGFLTGLRRCCAAGTRLAIETPDVDWILRTGAFHDFFYEHCSLFSAAALDRALARTGFLTTRLERVFDDQYLWAEARPLDTAAAETVSDYERTWAATLADAARAGPVVIWGAGAKGATFAQMFDPDAALIAAVVDVNPAKQGLRLGGSAHPIVAPAALKRIAPKTVVIMNPAYEAEIGAHLSDLRWTGRVLVVK